MSDILNSAKFARFNLAFLEPASILKKNPGERFFAPTEINNGIQS